MRSPISRRTFAGTIALTTIAGCLTSEPSEDGEDEEEADGSDGSNGEGSNQSNEWESSPEAEDVTFESTDGTRIEGAVYGDSDCGVVLTPQINRDRESWEEYAQYLADEGYLAVAINEDEDDRPGSVLGATRYLTEERDARRVVLLGASSGGEASVIANARAEIDAVAGVVALSPGGGTDYASDLRGRKLFVVAEDDDERFVQTTREIHERAPEPKELQVYSGSEHGQELFETDHREDLQERTVALVDAACRDD